MRRIRPAPRAAAGTVGWFADGSSAGVDALDRCYGDDELMDDPGRGGSRVRARAALLARSRVMRLLLQFGVLAVVAWLFVVPRVREAVTQGEIRAISGFGWPLLAAGAQVVSLGAYAFMTRAVLAGHPRRPPYRRLLAIDLASIAVSNTVPVGAAAGTGVGVRLLAREGIRPAEAASAKFLQGVVAAIALALITGVAAIFRIEGPGLAASDLTSLRIGGPVLGGVLTASVVLALAVGTAAGRRVARSATGLVPVRLRPHSARLSGAVGRQVRLLMSEPRVLVPTSLAGAVNWLADAFSLWCCMHAFGFPATASGLVLSFGLATAVGWLPITPGGVGVVEAVLIPGLIGLGSGSYGAAVLGVLMWRLVHSWLPVPLGLLGRISLSHRATRFVADLRPRHRRARRAAERRRLAPVARD